MSHFLKKLMLLYQSGWGTFYYVNLCLIRLCARDRWLKPNGVMYPSHARLWMAPIRSALVNQKMNQYEGAMDDWYSFLEETKSYYGVDMSVLTRSFDEEQKKYFLHTSLWSNLRPEEVIGTPAIVCEIDCLTATIQDIAEVRSQFSCEIHTDARLCGFGGWFDVHFRGRMDNPAEEEIELTTEPSEEMHSLGATGLPCSTAEKCLSRG
ncbi:hypothetical protein MLD38_014392 [Melastoma candidum]|uniref:Uncharacterized protein n=1 Tax=Melastoma candidum TaxID=119954 RepID=A0ACB9RGC4_9MYRT|nr:hypothetical protein MLD38_014392 [Melastoma candidum]